MTVVIFVVILTFVSVCQVQCHYRDVPALDGLVGNCTGTEIDIELTPSDLEHLSLIVFGKNGKKRKYLPHEMDKLIKDPNINFKKKTMFFITGYLGSPYFFLFAKIGDMYKNMGYNVISLDVNHFTTVYYPLSVRYMRATGKKAAEMLFEVTKAGLDIKNMEMVGLSLGGQTMSYVAKGLRDLTGQKVARLTGLDPAGPCYEDVAPENKLHPSDADFVDVVYTNIEGLGTTDLAGHVNFYINGGHWQPGELWWYPCMNLCSHLRSYNIWFAALKFPDKLIGMKCDSVKQAREKNCYDRVPLETNVVGLDVDKNKPGIYYVSTSYKYPYYLAEKGLRREYKYERTDIGTVSLFNMFKLLNTK